MCSIDALSDASASAPSPALSDGAAGSPASRPSLDLSDAECVETRQLPRAPPEEADVALPRREHFRTSKDFKRAYDRAVKLRTQKRELHQDLATIRGAWGTRHLRVGEQLRGPRPKGSSDSRAHPRAWTAAGLLRVAFERLGTTCSRRSKTTTHTIEATAAVALTHCSHQADCLRQFKLSLETRATKPPWIWVNHAWDDPPCM